MRRSLGILAGVVLSVALTPTPAAHAVGAAACTISGTITFTPTTPAVDRGDWHITPAVIQCRGWMTFSDERMLAGNGSFTGAGPYTTMPTGEGGCLRQLGTGTVDYWIPTNLQVAHIQEQTTFHLVGVGAFTTPTLRGTFQIPVHDRNCLTTAGRKGLFVAEATMVRTGRQGGH